MNIVFGGGILLYAHVTVGQQLLSLSEVERHIHLSKKAVWFAAPLKSTLADTLAFRWEALPSPLSVDARKAHWLKFGIVNDFDTTKQVYFYTLSSNQHVVFFIKSPLGDLQILESGTMLPTSRWAHSDYDNYIPLRLRPRQQVQIYARIANRAGLLPTFTGFNTPKPSLNLILETEKYHLSVALRDYRRNMPEFQYRSWIQGALLLVLLFVGLLYWQYRQRIFLYYGGYVLAGVLFSLLKTRAYTPLGHALGEWPLLKTHLMESVMWWGIGFYLLFVGYLLDLSKNYPKVYRWFRRMAIGLIGYGLFYLVVILLTNDGGLQQISFWGGRIVAIPIYVGTLVWMARKVKSPMIKYVLWANGVLFFFGIIAWLRAGEVILKGVKLPADMDDLLTLSFAVVMEILILSLALAQRFRWLEKEKTESQKAYFQALENKNKTEKRIAETEMQALRSQMNPHFLFNSLNSLEYFIMTNDEHKATQHLAKFSKLLRMTLTHSREAAISLADELTTLRLYLDIESARLGEGFSYNIEISKNINPYDIEVPPMLLQPFVENAIWHGLMPSQNSEKCLLVRVFQKEDNKVLFEIEDNGIGLQKATELRNRSTMKRKSYGMEITQQRIELFNRNYPHQLNFEIFDFQKNNATGTLVRIEYHTEKV